LARPTAVVLLGLLAVFWGVNWPALKLGLTEYPPWVFRSLASVVGGLGLLVLAWLGGQPLRVPRREWKGLFVASMLNMTAWNLLLLYGLERMNSGRAAILAYTMPMWASLIGTFVLGERLSGRGIAALALGLAGMALLFDAGGESGNRLGPLLVLLSAVSWGAGTVAIKHYRFTMPVTVLTAWQHLVGVAPIVVGAVAFDVQRMGEVSLGPTLCVVYNMTVTSIFCYWAYFKVVSNLPVVVSTVGTLMVPLVGVFSDALVFGTRPAGADYVALVAVAGAVFLVLNRPSSAGRSRSPPRGRGTAA
jgi:drug/metabolite transporter (DMT)-like permease